MRWLIVAGVGAAAVVAALVSCASFDDGDEPSSSSSGSSSGASGDGSPTDTGSDIDASTGFGSCAPLGRSVGYFAQFTASDGSEIAGLAAEPAGGVWVSGVAKDLDLGLGAHANGAFLVKLDDSAKASQLEIVPSTNLVRGDSVVLTANRRYWSVIHENSVTYRDAGFAATTDGGFSTFVAGFATNGVVTFEAFSGSVVLGWGLAPVAGEGLFVGGSFVGGMNGVGQAIDAGTNNPNQMFAARVWSAAGGNNGIVSSKGNGDRVVRGATTDSTGRLHLTGRYSGNAPFGTAGAADESDAYVATFNSDLSVVEVTKLGGPGMQEGYGLAALPDGIVVVGQHSGAILGPDGSSLGKSYGKNDGFVAKLGPGLNVIWAATLGGSEDDTPVRVVHDPVANRVLVVGTTASAKLEMKQTQLLNATPGVSSTFVAMMGATSGGNIDFWAPKGGESPRAIAVDAAGRVYIAGMFGSSMTVGSVTHTATSKSNLYVIRCDP